jgi:hypothetical protein
MGGWIFLALLIIAFSLIAAGMLALTVIGAARAWRNGDPIWVAVIVGAWIFASGWAAGLFYLVAIDATKKRPSPAPPA